MYGAAAGGEHEPGALVTGVGVALGQETEHLAVTDGLDLSRSRVRNAVTATDSASLGSFFVLRPEPNRPVRAARVAGTLRTCSPAARSCWASKVAHAVGPRQQLVDCVRVARTFLRASSSSVVLIATAVCDALCGRPR
jgi:hypothetical protein